MTDRKDLPADGVQPDMTLSAVSTGHVAAAPPGTSGPAGSGPAEFVTMIRDHDTALRALAFRLLGDRHLMDDALQEAYLKAFRAQSEPASSSAFRGDAALGTWLYRITYNVCLDMIRSGSRRPAESLESAYPAVSADRDPGDIAADRTDLAAALATLPPEQRAAVLLVDAEGLDYRAAGEVLGVGAGTVGSRVSRGRAALRAALTPGELR